MSTPPGSSPPFVSVNSYRIFQRRRPPALALSQLERWVQTHQALAVPAALVAFGALRSVNLAVLAHFIAPVFTLMETPMVGRNLLGVVACVSALVGLITRKSPHRAVSGIYYRVISSLFVPRFVTNSVWAINADSVDWKQVIGVAGSVAGSQASSGVSSEVRSFRIPDSSFKKRRYARSADGRRVLLEGRELGKGRETGVGVPKLIRARSMDRPPMSVSTPGQSPRTLRLENEIGEGQNRRDRTQTRYNRGQNEKMNREPKMSRIVSGQSLMLAEMNEVDSVRPLRSLPLIDAEASVGNKGTVSSIRNKRATSLPEARTPPPGSVPEEAACPLSPAASIESSASFSRSVSDYVDSWLQSLKGGAIAGGWMQEQEGDQRQRNGEHNLGVDDENMVCSPRRASLDAPGAHRHYVHGSVTATDASIVPLLDKYALAAQLQAKNLVEEGNVAYPGHLRHKGAVLPSALDSVGLDGDCPQSIRHLITDEHLLQLGDIIGERACTQLIHELSIEHAFASPSSLFGVPDAGVAHMGWEKSSSGGKEGMLVAAERKLLRDNYYMYRTVVHIHGVEPSVVRPFHLDDQARTLWDDSCISCEREVPPGETRVSKHSESCMHRYICRFPRPLSGRNYEYARRVWTRPSDGGCYAICKACTLPSGVGPSKYCLVKEYVSACCIEGTEEGTRITTVYFENNQARPGLNKIAVPKGLLPFWFKYESSLRVFAKAKQVNTRRRSLDEPAAAAEDEGNSSGSDDEVYDALAELKRRSKERERRKRRVSGREENEKITKWAQRIILAAAVKLALDP